ncbi:MAG: phosphatidylinositol-specific phospholipase C1-like protein [Schlesneria sp.]
MKRATNLLCQPGGISLTLGFLLSFLNHAPSILGDDLRLNQIQLIGTHNSYHLAPTPATLQLIESANRDAASKLDYTHLPLEEQFSTLGIRQVELDVYADPEGGRFATPLAYRMLNPVNGAAGPDPNHDGALLKPGFKILHVPDVDYRTTVRTLQDALQRIQKWSASHPTHVPLFVLIELKDEKIEGLTLPIKFTRELLNEIDAAIQGCFENEHLITPDQVRKSRETLREAVLVDGWPSLDACRGRVLFALDNEGRLRDDYLAGHPSLAGRMMFVSARSDDSPEAAFFKINDPIQNHAEIHRLVKQGFLVRTRADADTEEARANDTRRREQAFSSGAQLISTDYPRCDDRFSEYCVRFQRGRMVRSNPVNSAEKVEISDIEPAK